MGGPKKVLLLVGSPKGSGSTSEALGSYLLERMGERGIVTEVARVPSSLRTEEERKGLLHAVGSADLLILATPLYADSLPSGVTRLLEIVAAEGGRSPWHGGKSFAALINCGFPEARQCDTAIAICRCFAREAGMEWAGGLALGGGESIGGGPPPGGGGGAGAGGGRVDRRPPPQGSGRRRQECEEGTRPGRRSPVGRAAGPRGGRFPDGEADGSGVDVYRHRGYRLETQGPEARDRNKDEGPALLA